MRGERSVLQEAPPAGDGSSPHARGTPDRGRQDHGRLRFIPACAGNALPDRVARYRMTVHPRMRGERKQQQRSAWPSGGSSPHARGTPAWAGRKLNLARFIPACAGNAIHLHMLCHHVPVHPRMRGERTWKRATSTPFVGSSPHARGTPRAGCSACTVPRFIPACAGNAPSI